MRGFDEFVGIEKEAAPRWRKEWGNLSEASQNRLRKSVASQANETTKRFRGSNKMGNSMGIVKHIVDPDDPAAIGWTNNMKPGIKKKIVGKLQKAIGNSLGPMYIRKPGGPFSPDVVLDHFSDGKNGKPNFKGLKGVSKLGGRDLKKVHRENPKLYKELQSIINDAHEVAGEGLVANKKIGRYAGSKYFSHFSPEVLHRESASVATATPEAKQFMTNMRSKKHFAFLTGMSGRNGIKPFDRVSEIDELRRNGGLEYGKDAVVNKSKLKQHLKNLES